MKLALICVALAAIVAVECGVTPEQLAKLIEYSKACREQTGATVEQVTKAIAGEFEDDPKLKAQLFCISKKIGFQNEDGSANDEILHKKLLTVVKDEKETDDLIKKCAVPQKTPEESAFQTFKCYFDTKGVNLLS
ncbi:B2 protein-like [Aethina tumida]|uniref:B2 protein-like n=1 Tax=Aethina tumida TaxID=116153 RepID=UPI00096B038A|nr:B2 protein-like [Aethina tumida]